MTDLRVLASGIDSLYASVRGQLIDGLLVFLGDLQTHNPQTDIPMTLGWGEPDLLLRSHGWRGYPYWFSSPRWELFVGGPDPLPPVYLQLHAEHIHSVGVEEAVRGVERMLVADLFPTGCRVMVSRADVFVDEQGWTPTPNDFVHFRCRAIRRRMFEVTRQEHGYGSRLSGFTFGKDDLVARIYDKTLEAAVTGKTWPELLWPGRDPDLSVWRVEFQYRRPVLEAMGLTGMGDVIRHRQGLWEYGTRWLTLREERPDSNRGRRPVTAQWGQLAGACLGGSAVPLIRDPVREAEVRRLTQGLVGYASSIEATGASHGVGDALAVTVPSVRSYLADRGTSFGDLVGAKRLRRLEVPR